MYLRLNEGNITIPEVIINKYTTDKLFNFFLQTFFLINKINYSYIQIKTILIYN